MKQIASNYSYSPTTNVVTLTGVNIDQDQLLLVVAPQVGRTMYNFASGVTGVVSAGANTRVTLNASTAGLTTTSPLVIFYDDHVPATSVTGTVALDPASLIALENVTVTIGSSVTVAGTVIANLGNAGFYDDGSYAIRIGIGNVNGGSPAEWLQDGYGNVPINGTVTASLSNHVSFNTLVVNGGTSTRFNGIYCNRAYNHWGIDWSLNEWVLIDSVSSPIPTIKYGIPPQGQQFSARFYLEYESEAMFYATSTTTNISAVTGWSDGYTVTPHQVVPVAIHPSNNVAVSLTNGSATTIGVRGTVTIGSCVTHGVRLQDGSGNNLTSTSIGGVQRLNVSLASAATPGGSIPSFVNVYGGTDGSAVRTISVDSTGRQNTNPQFPRVTFIDGSGTVATANTAITVFASSSTRSYLLVQVTTGSAFVNVGATATTVNGINLTAGQGYAWETTIPQGIVSLISTTTSSRYVAKEA